MLSKNDMTQLYLETAPAFLTFLENEKKKLQAEIAKLQADDDTAVPEAALEAEAFVAPLSPDANASDPVLDASASAPNNELSPAVDGETETAENENGTAVATADPDLLTNNTKQKRGRLGGHLFRRTN